jgi:hypothetical protein
MERISMNSLEQIKNEVAQEWGHKDWNDFGESFKHRLGSAHDECDDVMTEIARRFAKAVSEDALKRAADNANILVSNGETHLDVKSYTLDDGIRFSPDYNRILSTPINTDI